MSNDSISNKVGNATEGSVGEEAQATPLPSSSLEYGKGVLGLGGNKAAASADDAAHHTHGGQTLGGLVNEGRDLAANSLGQAQTVIAGAEKKTNEAAGDAKEQGKPVGYVAQAGELATDVVGVAQSYAQAGAAKVDEAAASNEVEGCYSTAERKYIPLKSADRPMFIKRSLRPHEQGRWHITKPYFWTERLVNEALALRYIAKHFSIPVPKVLACYEDDGACHLITEYVEGILMCDLPEGDFDKVVPVIERYRAELARHTSTTIRSLAGPPIFPARLRTYVEDVPSDQLYDSSPEGYPLCHGDLSSHNILVDPDTLEVKAVLDWEYAGYYPEWLDMRFYVSPLASGMQASVLGIAPEDAAKLLKLRRA